MKAGFGGDIDALPAMISLEGVFSWDFVLDHHAWLEYIQRFVFSRRCEVRCKLLFRNQLSAKTEDT